jgi:hypothetical protein
VFRSDGKVLSKGEWRYAAQSPFYSASNGRNPWSGVGYKVVPFVFNRDRLGFAIIGLVQRLS